jgi:hypothetical protein
MKKHDYYEISKSQIDVWEWKESIHEEVKDLNIEDGLKYIIKKSIKTKELFFDEI